jgi:hypothetical protein
MNRIILGWLACLSLVLCLSTVASAQDTSHSKTTPPIMTAADPDCTGYPFINGWKGHLDRNVNVFLNNTERQSLTQARVDQVNALLPAFQVFNYAIASRLTSAQCNVFTSIVAIQDMETMATYNNEQWSEYVVQISQQLRLDADQESELRSITRRLIASIAPIHQQYAANFDQQIAAAEQRQVAERAVFTRTISTETIETK